MLPPPPRFTSFPSTTLFRSASYERRLRDLFQHLPIKLDVKNEARVHLWYEDRFGYAIKPYLSSADAIATFPTTATAVRSEEHTSELQSLRHLVCRLLLEKKK